MEYLKRSNVDVTGVPEREERERNRNTDNFQKLIKISDFIFKKP